MPIAYLNFEEQITFYGQYHNNAWNRVIHLFCIPLIFWAFMVMMAYFPVIIIFDRIPFNLSFALTFSYIFYYILLEPVAGAAFAPFLLTVTYSANVFAIKSNYNMKIPVIIQIFCWCAQLISHYFIEKRSPAFFDSTFQSFSVAPFFVFLELLFAFGYRPALQKRIHEKVKTAIAAWKLRCERNEKKVGNPDLVHENRSS